MQTFNHPVLKYFLKIKECKSPNNKHRKNKFFKMYFIT